MVLWAVLAVIAIAAGAFALTRGDSGGGGLAKLPIALGSGGARTEAAAGIADMKLAAPITYVAGKGLPALGGEGDVYSYEGAATDDAVSRLAEALGLSGKVQREDQRIFVQDGDRIVEVYAGPGLPWSTYSTSGVSGGVAIACAPDGSCPEQPLPERPADLPSKDQAVEIATDLLGATGLDVSSLRTTVDDAITAWGVTADPVVDGLATWGATSYITIGAGGRVESANGYLATPKLLDSYPLIDTAAAIDRLNDSGGWYGGGPVPMMGAARDTGDVAVSSSGSAASGSAVAGSGGGSGGGGCVVQPDGSEICLIDPADPAGPATTIPSPSCPPGADCPMPCDLVVEQVDPALGAPEGSTSFPACGAPIDQEPITVTLTDASRILLFFSTYDGTDALLVPGYLFTGDDGSTVPVAAVPDEVIAPPEPVKDPGVIEPGAGGGSTGSGGAPPPTTGTSAVSPNSQTLVSLSVTLYHCGVDPVDFDGIHFVADPPPFDQTNAPADFAGEGKVIDYTPDGFTYIDASGAEIQFHAVPPDYRPKPCA
jgi:hypothetical protein